VLKNIKSILNNNLYAMSLYARQIAGTLVLFIIARYLTVYDFGLFSSYKNIATFCFMFANLGFADYILVSSQANVKEVKIKISIFIINAICIAFIIAILSSFFNLDNHYLFWLVVIRTFFDGIFFVLILPYFQATKKFNIIATINIIYACCITIIAVLSFIFKLSLVKFLIINIILGLINFIQCSYYAKIKYFIHFTTIKKIIKYIDKSIWAYIGVTIAYFLYAQIPSLYVSTFLTKTQAALYFSAFTIASIINLLIGAQTQKMIPEMIRCNIAKIKPIINQNLSFLLVITTGVFIFMLIFGKLILQLLYGQSYYRNAYPILLILMIGNICVAEAAVFGTYITASGNQRKKIPMQLEATAITILSLFLFNKLNIYGAAISFLLAAIYVSYRYTTFTLNFIKQETIKENTCNR
jgi:PST family polysaccharide transporter